MKVYVRNNELKRRILQTGHSLTSFAEKIDISRSFLSYLVNQNKTLSPELAQRIAKELNADFDELFFVGTTEEYAEIN